MAFLKSNPNNSGLRGRMAGQVYAGEGEDTIVRGFAKPTHNETPAAAAAEARFTRGSQGWALLTDAQRAAWTAAAKGVKSKDPRRIRPVSISGANLYTALTAKFLQANPGGTVPANPPATKFSGDTIGLSVAFTGGNVVVTSTGANRTGVTTEILTQRLDAAYRKPTKAYVHQAFASFTSTVTAASFAMPVGAYSVAVQFVETATGQVAGYQVLGTVTALTAVAGGLADEDGLRQAA